jgi:phosphotransferase system HPr-like phosphotransfer protein
LEVLVLKSIKISLQLAQRVKEFVNITQDYAFEILLKSGKYVVDAKSILGIFSLDLSQPIIVEAYDDNCDELMEKLQKFQA